VDEEGFAIAYAGPSVRKFAREVGVDLIRVHGSGRKGRITHQDVKQYIKGRLSEAPAPGTTSLPRVPDVDFARFGPVEVRPLGRIRKISGPRLQASWLNIPHVTQHDEADITDMETMRKALKDSAAAKGIRVTPLAFLMRACAMALQEFPQFNTSLDSTGENLVFKQYINIGFAADTENGLVVPVVRDADKKDLFELAHELAELSAAGREGKLTAAQMQGGCFTISSLGGIGGTAFTPIVNAPEVAILGASRARMAPVYDGKEFLPRLMLPLSLSYDHRVIDGADAARFTTYLAQALADVSRLIQAIP
jgi:pyruvate dehydrogenase E2 component (dihydrolipoamide acetyltransferase)